MFIRTKVVNGTTYYQAVQGYRDEQGRVRHRTVASLGRHATPDEAIAAAQQDLHRLGARIHALEPLAERSPRNAKKVERLRARIARLNQRVERLLACAVMMPLSRQHQACVNDDITLPPTTDTGETFDLDGVGAQSDEQRAAQERITLAEQRHQEAVCDLLTLMEDIRRKDEEETRPLLEEMKTFRVEAASQAWKELRAERKEIALELLTTAFEAEDGIERILMGRRGMLGLGPYDEAAQQLRISRETLETWLQRDPLAAKAGYYVGVADGQARNKRGASRMTAKQLLENLRPAIIAEAYGRALEYVCLEESRTPEEAAALRQRTIRAKERLDKLTSIA